MRPYCVILWQCLTASGPPVLPRNHKTPMGWLMGFSGFGPKSPTLLNKSKGNKNQRRVWRLAIWHRKLMDQEVSILENSKEGVENHTTTFFSEREVLSSYKSYWGEDEITSILKIEFIKDSVVQVFLFSMFLQRI